MIQQTRSCSECNNELPPDNWGGMVLAPREWGFYGGFTDNEPWIDVTENDYIHLCHDCSLRLVRSFSSIAKKIGAGGHPPRGTNDKSCCEYSWWVIDDVVHYGDKSDGSWHKQPLVRDTIGE